MDFYKFDKLMGIIAIIAPLFGIIGWFYFDSTILLIIGFILSLFHTWYIWPQLNSGAKFLEFLVGFIGMIIGRSSMPMYISCMLSICVFDFIMELLNKLIHTSVSSNNKNKQTTKNIEEELLDIVKKESVADNYAEQIVKNSPIFEMDFKIAKAFVGILIISEKRGNEIALDYFDRFIKYEMEKNTEDLGWGVHSSYLCGVLNANDIIDEEKMNKLSVMYIEYYSKNYISIKKDINQSNNNKIKFCRKCGVPLVEGAKYCNKCGTKVIMEEKSYDMSKMQQ